MNSSVSSASGSYELHKWHKCPEIHDGGGSFGTFLGQLVKDDDNATSWEAEDVTLRRSTPKDVKGPSL